MFKSLHPTIPASGRLSNLVHHDVDRRVRQPRIRIQKEKVLPSRAYVTDIVCPREAKIRSALDDLDAWETLLKGLHLPIGRVVIHHDDLEFDSMRLVVNARDALAKVIDRIPINTNNGEFHGRYNRFKPFTSRSSLYR